MSDVQQEQAIGPKAEAQQRSAQERERKARPATTGDIEKLIAAVNTGWIGRGFAIGFGMVVLSFVAGIILTLLWMSLGGRY